MKGTTSSLESAWAQTRDLLMCTRIPQELIPNFKWMFYMGASSAMIVLINTGPGGVDKVVAELAANSARFSGE